MKTPFFETLTVPCTNLNVTTFDLPLDEVLRDAKKILALEAYQVANVSMSPDGYALANATVFAKSFLTLVTKGVNEEVITTIPLYRLVVNNNYGVPFEVDIPALNITKCYVSVSDTENLSLSEVWLLGFHYVKGGS